MCRQLRQCWPFERKRTRCIVCVSFILILGLVIGISIGSNAIAQSKRPITLLHRERVTPGETYQIELNNQSDAQGVCMSDLCSTRSCSQVTLTIDIDPTSIQFTGELDASCCKLDLEKTNTLIAMLYNHTIKDTKSYSDWVFHLHCGSTLNITLCAEATGPECHDTEKYNFVIIQGEKNFSLWSSGRDFLKYTKNFITLETIADCRSQSATLPLYTYSENADYYHVIRNSATHDCDIRVFAHAIFERKQYLNKKATPCTVGNDNPSCPKYTASAKYVTVEIDIDTKVNHDNILYRAKHMHSSHNRHIIELYIYIQYIYYCERLDVCIVDVYVM